MTDDARLIREFVDGFQDIDISDAHACQIAGIVRPVNDAALSAAAAMPLEAEASSFLMALEAEDQETGRAR